MSNQQLTLNVQLKDSFRFDSFYIGSSDNSSEKKTNRETIQILKEFSSLSSVGALNGQTQNFLWGDAQSGKTHLLQACCANAGKSKKTVSYIPLKSLKTYGPEVLLGLGHSELIAVDDVDVVIGSENKKDWELALFSLINQTRENSQSLILSSTQNPRKLHCHLPDLASRLIWGGSYRVHSLADEDKPQALQARALQRGFEINDKVLTYLFRRYPRDLETLMEILNKLDEESLRQKMLITVPFVKQVLG